MEETLKIKTPTEPPKPDSTWRTDRPRIGRLVEIRFEDLGGLWVAEGRWWGIDGWQVEHTGTMSDHMTKYLAPTYEVAWRAKAGDHEVRLLLSYLLSSLWHDLRSVPRNLLANIKAVIKEARG